MTAWLWCSALWNLLSPSWLYNLFTIESRSPVWQRHFVPNITHPETPGKKQTLLMSLHRRPHKRHEGTKSPHHHESYKVINTLHLYHRLHNATGTWLHRRRFPHQSSCCRAFLGKPPTECRMLATGFCGSKASSQMRGPSLFQHFCHPCMSAQRPYVAQRSVPTNGLKSFPVASCRHWLWHTLSPAVVQLVTVPVAVHGAQELPDAVVTQNEERLLVNGPGHRFVQLAPLFVL